MRNTVVIMDLSVDQIYCYLFMIILTKKLDLNIKKGMKLGLGQAQLQIEVS